MNGNDADQSTADEREPETIDAETGLPDPLPPAIARLKLSSLKDIRLEMAAVYRQVKAGRLEDNAGSKRVFMLRQIADVIVNAELERRLQDLEERHALRLNGSERQTRRLN